MRAAWIGNIVITDKANSSWIGDWWGRGGLAWTWSVSRLVSRSFTSMSLGFLVHFTSNSLRFHFYLPWVATIDFYVTVRKLRFHFGLRRRLHFDFISSSRWVHFDVTSISLDFSLISLRLHFDFTLMSLRFDFDFTSISLRVSFGFTWMSLHFHLTVCPCQYHWVVA